jgi:hypothetical protein
MDQVLAPDVDSAGIADAGNSPLFYVVSKRKFAILFLATFGGYAVYWFYKNWDRYRDGSSFDSEAGSIWPFPRAIFAIFFVHSLFRKIKAHAPDKPALTAWASNAHAWQLIVFLLAGDVLDRASARSIGSPYTDYLSIVIMAPMLALFLWAQEKINISCDDPSGAGNNRLTKANYFWIILGALWWALVILGYFVPEYQGSGDSGTF